jgi:Big-like domain-containing protein
MTPQRVQRRNPPQNIPDSPIARIVVTPATQEVTAGDTVRFTAEARDASGRRIENAIIRFVARGGQGEGSIDSAGTLIASSVGKMPINVVAIVPGTRPKVQPVELRMVPGPATRIEIRSPIERIVCGQQLRLGALAFTKVNDRARDALRWSSSAPNVVRVDQDGMLTAVAPGRATLTAQAGSARRWGPASTTSPRRAMASSSLARTSAASRSRSSISPVARKSR